MAVLVSIARGHSACYPFTTVGAADGATITGERGVGYNLSVVEKVGEPAGTWVGNGAAELGFHDRDTVRREDFRRAAARPGAHLARRRARDTAWPRANRPAGGTDAKARRGTRRDTRAGLGRTAGWLHSHSELTHAQERAAMAGRPGAGAGSTFGVDSRGSGARHCPEPARPREQPGPGGHVSDSLRRANGKSIYRARRASGTPPRAAVHRTATTRRRVRRRRAAACVRTGRRGARRRPSLVRFPCHRGPDHGAGLHKGHGAGRREYSSVLMSRVGAAHQGADPARHAGVADPRATGAGANARGTSPLPRSERHHHRSAEQGGGVT